MTKSERRNASGVRAVSVWAFAAALCIAAALALAGCSSGAASNAAADNAANANAAAADDAANANTAAAANANANGDGAADAADDAAGDASQARTLSISANGQTVTAKLADNSSVDALVELLQAGPVTVEMNDFSNFEKVGELPRSLPRNDMQISTDAGDLILYQGNRFVIYYGQNSWDFTYLGHIEGATKEGLLEMLGSGSVTVELRL